MITGFEEITKPLTQYERVELLPVLVKGLRLKIGKEKAVTNKVICERLKALGYKKVSPARIRKLINYIRINKIIHNLISPSRGYYVATTAQEVKLYTASLRDREAAIAAVRESFYN